MNLFKNIKNAKYFIGELTKTAKSAKTKEQKLFYKGMINSFISLVNISENLMQDKFKTDVIDSLLLSNIYKQLQDQERQSMNYNDKIFVVGKLSDSSLKLLGTIDTDVFVQVNYELELEGSRSKLGLNIKSNTGDLYGSFTNESTMELKNMMFNKSNDDIDMNSIVRNVKVDIDYVSAVNMDKVVMYLSNKELELQVMDVDVNKTNLFATKKEDIKLLMNDLLDKFKEDIKWN